MSTASTSRRAPAAFVLVLLAALLAQLLPGVQAPAEAAAFRPGMIMSDGVFNNSASMSANDVQTFLNQKGASCVASAAGIPCLKDFRQSTPTRAATPRCATYSGAANESAATIIQRIGTACGINPQVLLVLLQKEQSLVTASGAALTPRKYQIATGFGCPDGAPCDDTYYGFFNQVYNAASQFRRYAQNPYGYAHVAGRTQAVRLHPNAACGSATVYIENQATASLYNYTPYTPNGALLAGRPDGCSSYGNFNFAKFFTDWFGSTQYETFGGIGALYAANKALLGSPTSNEVPGLVRGGALQRFTNGTIYWTPAARAFIVRGGIATGWGLTGWEGGVLGYPASAEKTLTRLKGSVQTFEGGYMYWSPVGGAQPVRGAIASRWAALGWESSWLGYPVTAQRGLRDGGLVQSFEAGHMYWSRVGGAQTLSIPFATRWASLGWESGPLGYPITSERAISRGAVQSFEGGSLYKTPANGIQPVRGGIMTWWAARGWEAGSFGYPTTGERTGLRAGGAVQNFERGAVYWTPMYGAKGVNGAILTAWGAGGWENGRLGYATSEPTVSGTTTTQAFEGGRITHDGRTGKTSITYR